MRIQVIACEVMFRELCRAAAEAEPVVDLLFLRKGLHDNPETMRLTLQEKLEEVDTNRVEAVVLGYGLCSNGTVGLRAPGCPLVIPRAHDCITLFLGSRQRYAELFAARPGTYYYTSGWLERGADALPQPPHQGGGWMDQTFDDLVARYGEDNARFLLEFQSHWRARYTTACYIRMPLSHRPDYAAAVQKIAAHQGWEYLEVEGDDRLFRAMVSGRWTEEEFLLVPPGEQIAASYDEKVLRCADCAARK
jgi:hypothetical protein